MKTLALAAAVPSALVAGPLGLCRADLPRLRLHAQEVGGRARDLLPPPRITDLLFLYLKHKEQLRKGDSFYF